MDRHSGDTFGLWTTLFINDQQQEGKYQIQHGLSQEELVGNKRAGNNLITADQSVYEVKLPTAAFVLKQKASPNGSYTN